MQLLRHNRQFRPFLFYVWQKIKRKGLIGKKSFLTGRSGQLDSGQMCFGNTVISIFYIL